LEGRVISLSGDRIAEGSENGLVRTTHDAERLGSSLADRLLREGAAGILADVRAGVVPVVSEP
jgi:hypothetical protein